MMGEWVTAGEWVPAGTVPKAVRKCSVVSVPVAVIVPPDRQTDRDRQAQTDGTDRDRQTETDRWQTDGRQRQTDGRQRQTDIDRQTETDRRVDRAEWVTGGMTDQG